MNAPSLFPGFMVPGPPARGDLRTRYEAWLATQMPRRRSSASSPESTERPPSLQPVASKVTRQGMRWGHEQAERTQAGWQALEMAWAQTPERVWIWSDLHLWHENICRYTGRPFASVEAMNQSLLAKAQARVASTDWLFFLGDLSFGSAQDTAQWLHQCPGHKALLVGNHDVDRQRTHVPLMWDQFEAVGSSLELAIPPHLPVGWEGVRTLWLTHYPLWPTWILQHVLNVHGHVHQHVLPGPRMNVSVEQTGLAPVQLTELLRAGRHSAPTVE